MIENIRKYNGLIILGLVVVAVALVVGLQSSTVRAPGGGSPYLKVGGRTYTDQEYKQLGLGALELIGQLARSGDFAMYQYIYSLAPESIYPNAPAEARDKFFINRMLLREASQEFGVYPNDEEISERIRSFRSFTGPDQKFNAETYGHFITRVLGRYGMTENDFRAMVADMLATEKVREIVGTGLGANHDAVTRQFTIASQQISGELAHLETTKFRQQVKPSDEELKSYWELIRDAFPTATQRKFTYLLVGAEMPEEAAVEEEKPESIADAAMSEEAKQKAAKEKEEAKAKREAELAEKRRAKQRELDAQVDDFTNTLIDQKGVGFEELAAEYKWELKTTDLITEDRPPADLALKLRSSSRTGMAIGELFKITPTSEPISKISEPVPVGENQWLVARLDEEIPSRTKTFEEAKEQVLAQYVQEKSLEAMRQAANEAAESIKSALAAGKTFAQAATEAGLVGSKVFTDITSSYRPDGLSEPASLFQTASTVDPGTLADPVVQADRAFLVHVTKREIVKSDEQESLIKNQVDIAANQNQMAVFSDWITSLTEAASVESLHQ